MKRLALAAALVVAFTSMTYAQISDNQGVTINAKIIQGLVLATPSGPLNFGEATNHMIVSGAVSQSDTTIDLSSGDARAVSLKLTCDGTQNVAVTYSNSLDLTGGLTFVPSMVWNGSSTSSASGTSVTEGASFSLGGTQYQSKSVWLWLGGILNGVLAATPGYYHNTLTVTVAYTTL